MLYTSKESLNNSEIDSKANRYDLPKKIMKKQDLLNFDSKISQTKHL